MYQQRSSLDLVYEDWGYLSMWIKPDPASKTSESVFDSGRSTVSSHTLSQENFVVATYSTPLVGVKCGIHS